MKFSCVGCNYFFITDHKEAIYKNSDIICFDCANKIPYYIPLEQQKRYLKSVRKNKIR